VARARFGHRSSRALDGAASGCPFPLARRPAVAPAALDVVPRRQHPCLVSPLRLVGLAPVLGALGVFASVRLATAQCPDGTPPPCAAQRPAAHLPSLAVLFMEPRSRNAADSLLAEGLTLEIINTLVGVTRLDVRSRWVSRHIAADADPIRSARSLGVDYLVDGVLELDSARVLVRGALTRTSTGRVVRSLRLERRRAELEGFQAAVAQEVAAAVVGQLLPSERGRFAVRRVDPRVTELLLRARAMLEHYTPSSRREALVLARQAVAMDSNYAPAWALLSTGYGQRADQEQDSVAENTARAMAAGDRAFALDSSNGEAMASAVVQRMRRNDFSPRTVALARRAVVAAPGVRTRFDLAWLLAAVGQVDEALGLTREAARHDSLSPVAWVYAGIMFSNARRFAEATGAYERALSLRPSGEDTARLLRARRWARLETGDCAGALADGRSVEDGFLVVESLRCLGRTAQADSLIDSRLALSAIGPASRAIYLAWREQPDSAFAVLDRAFPTYLANVLRHPAFDPYRRHPRYVALLRRMGMEPQ
jgi:TolB-like protein